MLLIEIEQSERVALLFNQHWGRVSSNLVEVGVTISRLQSNNYTAIWEVQGQDKIDPILTRVNVDKWTTASKFLGGHYLFQEANSCPREMVQKKPWASRNRQCPKTNIGAYFLPNGGSCI